jgi:hypothetical protein
MKKKKKLILFLLVILALLIALSLYQSNVMEEVLNSNSNGEEERNEDGNEYDSYLPSIEDLLNQEGPVYMLPLYQKDLLGIPELSEKYPELEDLLLGDNFISSIDPSDDLFNLRNLKMLDLENNLLTEIPKEIKLLENLEGLYLSGNKLKTLPDELGELSNLKTITLINNNFTEAEKERLKKMLPEVKIIFEQSEIVIDEEYPESFVPNEEEVGI